MKLFKNVLITTFTCISSFLIFGISSFYLGSIFIPMFNRVDSDFGLGYLGGLVWLFGIGGFVGLIIGILVSVKIWKKI